MYDDFGRQPTFEDQRYPGGSVMDRYPMMGGGPMADPHMHQGRGGYDEDFEYRGFYSCSYLTNRCEIEIFLVLKVLVSAVTQP